MLGNIQLASESGPEATNLSNSTAQRSSGSTLPISDSVLAHRLKVDTSLTIGALANLLAENKVTQAFLLVTDMPKNIATLWKKARLCMQAVASTSEMELWSAAERSDSIRVTSTQVSDASSKAISFRVLALTLESRVKDRLEAEEMRLHKKVSGARQLSLNSLGARISSLKKLDPTVDLTVISTFISTPSSSEESQETTIYGNKMLKKVAEGAATAAMSAKATAFKRPRDDNNKSNDSVATPEQMAESPASNQGIETTSIAKKPNHGIFGIRK
jgi:hypothetical protein